MTQDKSRAWLSGMGPFHDRSLIEAELTTGWKVPMDG